MDFLTLAMMCAPMVAPSTLQAISKKESSFRPYVININGGWKLQRQPRNKQEAITAARWLLQHGYNIDMGLGQLNHKELSGLGMTVEDAFDECKNLHGSGTLLLRKYKVAKRKFPDEQDALRAAISAYNTGNHTTGFRNGYVQGVVRNAQIYQNATP